jgi:hypothetical protein
VRETASLWWWGALVPLAAVGMAVPTRGHSVLLLTGYVALASRIFTRLRARGYSTRDAALYATFCIVGKFAEVQGAALFLTRHFTRARAQLIEYRTT